MTNPLAETIDGTPFVGLAVTFVHTGYNASVDFGAGNWSPHEFAMTASEAILKCIAKHAPPPALPPPPY